MNEKSRVSPAFPLSALSEEQTLRPAFAAGLERSGRPVRQHALVKFSEPPIRRHIATPQLLHDIRFLRHGYHLFCSYTLLL